MHKLSNMQDKLPKKKQRRKEKLEQNLMKLGQQEQILKLEHVPPMKLRELEHVPPMKLLTGKNKLLKKSRQKNMLKL